MKFAEQIFKAYDIRGLVPDELTPELVEAVGRAVADFLPGDGAVAVGHDMRPDSARLAEEMIKGLTAQGRDVWDIGMVTTDMVYFAAGHFNLAGGAMITASHNPGSYNGIKLCREEARPIGVETGLADIKQAIIEDSYYTPERQGVAVPKNVMADWIEFALGLIDVRQLKDFKVAIDAGNGMAGAVIPKLMNKVPLKIVPMYFEPDGTFPNHLANPSEPENLRDLIGMVQSQKLDFGLAFDGDGDRAVLVDEKGEPVSGSVMTALLAEEMLRRHPGSNILHNAVCGRIVPETIEAMGGKPIRTKVGHSYIKAKMAEHDAPFAGEHSGHYYFRDNFNADSGLVAALVTIQVLSEAAVPLSKLADRYRKYHASGEINSEVTDKDAKLQEVAEKYSDGEQDWLDGLTVNYEDWWFNLRPSNTEPLLRLNVEAETPDTLTKKTEELLRLIRG